MFQAAVLFCGTALSAAQVTVDRLNIRTGPSRDSMPAGTVSHGTVLHVISEKDGWTAIKAPKDLSVWISSAFVRNGRVLKGARLRSGPGVFHPEYEGKLPENYPVKILELSKDGYWFRIEPPPHLICYVSSRYLTASADEKNGRASDKKAFAFLPGESHPVSIEGKLVPLLPPINGADYKLILELNGKIIPLCFLHSRHLNLKLWENRTVRIEGLQRWVGNIRHPFIEIVKVSPSWK